VALNNSQYDSIMRDYSRRQNNHRHLLEEHMREVREALPRIKEIDDAVASVSVACGRRLLSGDSGALAGLKEEIAALAKERREVLIRGGYPADYLEMTYDCPDCRDTGYIDNRKCHCFRRAEIDLLYTQSNLTDILDQENFDTFSYDYYSDEVVDPQSGISSLTRIRRVMETCRKFVDEFDNLPGNLFFYGDTGVGKTFLSHCIAKELLDSTHSVVYFSAQELFEAFARKRFSRPGETEDHTDCIYECDLLIIDDLGTELTNTFVNSELFLCINHRLSRNKATIISTNLSLKSFADTYSERIFSRISNHYTMLKLFGRDIRLQKKLRYKTL
jgi:DNA replication protein DnaC